MFDRLLSESDSDITALIESNHALAHYAIAVFGHSRYLGETLIQNPDLFHSFIREKNLYRSLSREEFQEGLARFRTRSFDTNLSAVLAAYKRREYVRVMLRDVLALAPLAETTAEISALSDALIEAALSEASSRLEHKYGTPQHVDSDGRLLNTPFAILSLGKLGGNELNYSSDIDLLFLYGDGTDPASASISSKEYFIRLAQQVTDILSRISPQGPVFRIDLRLRPEGNQGELAVSLGYALSYYADSAQDWERQALIKIRHSAGDAKLSRRFLREIQPCVYTETINFAAIKTALVSREKIQRHARSKGTSAIDVKLDPGGIRDIEFLVQCLQRVYGGKEPWLRSGGTLFSLQKLYDKGHLSGHEFHELNGAYAIFRHLEHRLQLRFGQQTHTLPSDPEELATISRAMSGIAPAEELASNFRLNVQKRMAAVSAIYQRIIFQQQNLPQDQTDAEFRLRGVVEPGGSDTNQHILARLAIEAQTIAELARREDLSTHARRNLYRFLTSAFTSSARFAAVRNQPEAVARAIALFDSSEYLTEILVRYPEEIAVLSELRESVGREGGAYLFDGPFGRGLASSDPVFEYIANCNSPFPERVALLRQHYRRRIFGSGAQDITGHRDVYRSLSVTTSAIEDAIAAAWAIAGQPTGVALLALGRLGTAEFDLLSDADLLFVCQDDLDRSSVSKAVEQFIQVLAAYTRDGIVCAVDTRLRPHGSEGDLVTSTAQLESYFAREAQAWEALMYTKLRFLIGSRSVADKVHASTRSLLARFAADASFRSQIHEMRLRLQTVERNFKLGVGGIYDIDFIVAYLLVQNGVSDSTGTLRDRIWQCVSAGLLDKSDGAVLHHAAELLRTLDHVIRLVAGKALKWLPATENARYTAGKLTAEILGVSCGDDLELYLESTLAQVRSVYTRVLAAG